MSTNQSFTIFLENFTLQPDNMIPPQTALNRACIEGNYQQAEQAIQDGADVNIADSIPLVYAVMNMKRDNGDHFEIIKLLLDNGANVNADQGFAIRWTSFNGLVDTVKLLLDHNADVHVKDNGALRWASRNKHEDIVQLLIAHGADESAVNEYY